MDLSAALAYIDALPRRLTIRSFSRWTLLNCEYLLASGAAAVLWGLVGSAGGCSLQET